jgi:hypothetical protein
MTWLHCLCRGGYVTPDDIGLCGIWTTRGYNYESYCFLWYSTYSVRWHSWLRHCATNRKVAGSFPECVIGIFHWHNPSGRTKALGLTQPLREMSTRNNTWPVRRVDNLNTFMCRLSWNLEASNSWNRQGLSIPVIGLFYLLHTSKVPNYFRKLLSSVTWGSKLKKNIREESKKKNPATDFRYMEQYLWRGTWMQQRSVVNEKWTRSQYSIV